LFFLSAVSLRFLRGAGIEIGALHSPMPVASGVSVTYVDRMSRPEQRASFTELRDYPFVEVDVIDDGERLDSIEDGSLDFVVASHMLEHCENPLGTIRRHAAKLRPGRIGRISRVFGTADIYVSDN
jgi:2-polyprenyl-3-methyl-5-hydroxy-6-metoxy-1,4-benzoquinol methylase